MTSSHTSVYAEGFPGASLGKESACSAGDLGSISGWGPSPGEGNGNPLQYSCLENPMDEGAWQATVHGVAKSRTRLSEFTLHDMYTWTHIRVCDSVCRSAGPALCEPRDCSTWLFS